MKLTDFDFVLPERLIAQHPLPERDRSRLMVVSRERRSVEHRHFCELPEILDKNHFLVLNTSRVFPARLWSRRPGRNERIEMLLVREMGHPADWQVLIRPARKALPGQILEAGPLRAQVLDVLEGGARIVRFEGCHDLSAEIDRLGEPPLPPYIRRERGHDFRQDKIRYQTVYARQKGSIAAPTAGLHFTPEVLRRLADKDVGLCEILLHVGYGTFQPVRSLEIEDHKMDAEYFQVGETDAARIREWKAQGRFLIAVGTTTTRVLEHLAQQCGTISSAAGMCDLFIYPGFEFRILNGIVTNFHLPQSTLFMLVCAFAGREFMLECYRTAIAREYRFFSYGDCMLIL